MAEEHEESHEAPAATPVSNPQYLGNVIAQAFTQAVQDKGSVYDALARRDPGLPDAVVAMSSSFYVLWDLTAHYLDGDSEERFRSFLEEELISWEHSKDDDEDEYFEEAAGKARSLLERFGEYKRMLRDAGLLTLVQRYEEGG